MKYDYSWNHILLLAKICARIDDEDSVTASWVQTTEEHNQLTFPFTLWPLSYRTCEVTTSPAMCSPVHIPSTDSACNYSVKIFKCNEVIIICIQNKHHSCDEGCGHPCLAELDGVVDDESGHTEASDNTESDTRDIGTHADHHSFSKIEPLLPCHTAHCYHRMKTVIKDAFYAIQENVECVICTGHGTAARIASCLASDMSRTYEAEREFLGLESRRVGVDFVGFSDYVVASPLYWEECSSFIDKYICIAFDGCAAAVKASTNLDTNMIVNPRCSRVSIDSVSTHSHRRTISRSMSVLHRMTKKRKDKNDSSTDKSSERDRHISDFVSALTNKITLPIKPRRDS